MISIHKINNLKYLFEHSKHEYYAEGADEAGFFAGRGAKYQKLEGQSVQEKQFERLARKGSDKNYGTEIVPSAPKDWGILYNRVSDEERAKMDTGYKLALQDLTKAIEENTYYRTMKDGKTEYELARGVTMAVFHHHTARPVEDKANPDKPIADKMDCDEHAHIVVFPKVMGQDGKFYSNTLYDLIHEKDGQGNSQETLKYFDQVFQYSLCKFLTQELGYTVERGVKDSFRISGISDELRESFSQRSEATKKELKNQGIEDASYAHKKKVSLKQRSKKSSYDLTELRKGWQGRMEEKGLTLESAQSMKGQQKDLDRNFDQTFSTFKSISNKRLKMMALCEAKFSNKSYTEKLEEFKSCKQLTKLNSRQNIIVRNHSTKVLVEQVQKVKLESIKAKNQGMTPSPGLEKSNVAKASKVSRGPQSSRIGQQMDELTASHAHKILEILSSKQSRVGEEGRLLAEELTKFNKAHAELMTAYMEAKKQEQIQVAI